MSGGNSKGGRSGNSSGGGVRRGGWEEAGAEFYQESYPGGSENIATLLPSKHMRTIVRRIRPAAERRQSTAARGTSVSRDVLVSMLPDLSENLSNEESTWEEIMQIKAMPVPMSQKREMKAQLQSATKLRLQGFDQLKWKRRKAWQGTRARIKETLGKLQLWRYSFKTIEGNFGTGVVAYFLLIKWLLFLNLAISSLIFFFVILPSVVFQGYSEPNSEICDVLESPNSTECCMDHYLNNTAVENTVLDIIQGTGWMEKTYLFYGTYSHKVFTYYVGGSDLNATFFSDDSGTKMYYNLPLAYVLIPIAYFMLSLVAIVKSAAKGFKERLIEGEGQFYRYCNLIFGGWDFCIHNEKSANIKNKALYNEMKACLEEERLEEEKQNRSKEEQIKLVFVRIFINVLVVSILIVAGFIIFTAFNFSLNELNSFDYKSSPLVNDSDTSNILGLVNIGNASDNDYKISQLDFKPEPLTGRPFAMAFELKMLLQKRADVELDTLSEIRIFILQYLPSLCIVVLNIIVPMIFQYLIRFEYYSPTFVVKLTLFRTVFLRLASLGVLLSQFYILINSRDVALSCVDSDQLQCWETYVGQQLYKLLIADFAVQFIVTFILNFPRSMIARHTESKFVRMIGEQEFDLPKHVLDVVYSQTLCWLGAFYCPMLPLIATVLCFFTFYIKKFACLVNSKPASTVYRASRSNSLFMLVLLISFCIAIIPVGYAVAEISPSRGCGPFKNLSTVWEEIIATFQAFPQFLRAGFFMIGTSYFALPAFILLILLLYYYWAVTDANRHMVSVLKSQLVLEGHDKQFLLNRLSAFIRQQQKRNERARQHQAHTNVEDNDSSRYAE